MLHYPVMLFLHILDLSSWEIIIMVVHLRTVTMESTIQVMITCFSHVTNEVCRRFYMWSNYGGCQNDRGWLMIADINHPGGVCPFEQNLPGLPAFIYSSLNTRAGSQCMYQHLTSKTLNVQASIIWKFEYE